jgi:hypothetical protein
LDTARRTALSTRSPKSLGPYPSDSTANHVKSRSFPTVNSFPVPLLAYPQTSADKISSLVFISGPLNTTVLENKCFCARMALRLCIDSAVAMRTIQRISGSMYLDVVGEKRSRKSSARRVLCPVP